MADKKLNPTEFPDPANVAGALLVFDATGNKLGFVTSAIQVDTAGGWSFVNPLKRKTIAGITASTTQTQGQAPLTAEINEISTVANPGDVVTMPALSAWHKIVIVNDGSNNLQIFPASGDDFGAGVDVSVQLEPNETVTFAAYNGTNWRAASSTEVSHAQAHAQDSTTAFVINDAGGDFHSYHSADFAADDLSGLTFDAGGNGVSFPIASIADSVGSPGTQILVTTTGSHGLAVGDIISQTNLSDGAYVGVFVVLATAAATTYEVAAVFGATGTGTMDQAATMTLGIGFGGSYHTIYHVSATPATNNETFDFQLFRNAAVAAGSKTRRRFGTTSDFGAFSGGAIVDLVGGDKVSFSLSNGSSAGNLTLRDFTLVMLRL